MTVLCVDASIVAKWILPENDTPLAMQVLRRIEVDAIEVVAPTVLEAEVTSAIYKRLRSGLTNEALASEAADAFAALDISMQSFHGMAWRAIDLARQFGQKYPYDAIYLALAERIGCTLLTADAAFYRAVNHEHPRVRLLADYAE